MSEKLLDWFAGRRASVVLDLIQKHVGKVEDTVTELNRALGLAADGKKQEVSHAIKRLYEDEEETDRIRRRLVEELAKGELKAKDREDLAHLVRRADIIADWAKDAAWNLETLGAANVKIPSKIWVMLVKIGGNLVQEVQAFRKSIIRLETDADGALKEELKVEDIEHKIDEEYHATKKMFLGLPKDFSAPAFMLLRDLLKDLEQVADFCEDAGDMVRSMAIRLKGP